MENVRYNNYHKHTYYSNICTLDVVTSPEDYMKRALELGHTTYFTTEHGYIGNVYEAKTLTEKYNLKLIAGLEAYYVKNRLEKDKSNYHLILIALNTDGYKDLNYLMSKSNVDGFYYKPRIDDELLFSINPKNIIVTSACIAGRMRNEDGRDEWIQKMKNYFGNNFYLEVQAHNCDSQAKYNKMILEYSKKYDIKIIHANDSHYISPEDSKYRDLFLKAKGLIYEEENDFILDYPTSEVIFDRYHKQGILNDEQIKEALNNTLIFDKCEELDINKEIKMPKIYDNPIEKLEEIIKKEWESEKINIDKSRVSEYENSIKSEFYTIKNTNMADYFLLNYELIKLATTKYGGVITKTGRGSAPSFYINKLLHFTDIDRIGSCITLFPSRFMSAARILGTKSLPDIDFNCSNQKPFYEASKKLLGDDGCYWMLAYKPLQTSSAFRLYCKSQDMNINEYNDVAINLAELAQAKKSYTESKYYKDDKWKTLIDESQHFVGVVESISQHPCSTLLMDKPISREVGLIKAGDVICANISSYESDNYKYLKNDLLAVTVWDIINKTCELAGIEVPTIRKLEQLLDEKTYEIYEKGLTTTINQADSNYATNLVRQYKPKSISDMSAFVAIIRPGCASLLDDFIDRKDYTTNIKELDDLLDDSGHRMIYQESIMKYLIWLGIEESETYTIIKKIAKKKFKEDELNKLKEKLLENWIEKTGFSKGFEETWQVVEDAAHYSFNASHSLSYAYDSLYGAYLKSHYPLEYYTVVLNSYKDDQDRTSKLIEELKYFKIKLKPIKYGKSRSQYSLDKSTNSIYKGIGSIKYLNDSCAEELYNIAQTHYDNFMQLLFATNSIGINSRQLDILIKLDFFSDFGNVNELLEMVTIFNKLKNGTAKTLAKGKLENPQVERIVANYSNDRGKNGNILKSYTILNMSKILDEINDFVKALKIPDMTLQEKIQIQQEYLGYISNTGKEEDRKSLLVKDIFPLNRKKDNVQFGYSIITQSLGSGVQARFTIFNETYNSCGKIKKGSLIRCEEYYSKNNYFTLKKYKIL